MVTYDYSSEENNPWDAATWNAKAQLAFMRKMRAKYPTAQADKRIRQFIFQSDTKGIPPKVPPKIAPYSVIVQKRFLVPPTQDTTLGFGLSGPVEAETQWTLPVVTERVIFPSSTMSDARCDVPPTGQVQLMLSTAINEVLCTVTFAAGSNIGTFTWTPPPGYIAAPGDLLYLFAPGPQDPTFAGVNIAFIGKQLSS